MTGKTNGNGPKSYSKFTLQDVAALGLVLRAGVVFPPPGPPPLVPSMWLQDALSLNTDIVTGSEKAKSEFIIAPIIRELVRHNPDKMTVFPGYQFDVLPEKGLTGYCDFIFSKSVHTLLIEAPVFFVVEAKSDNLETGTAQCIAEMYAAQIFNHHAGKPPAPVYGAVTWGLQWRFYKLEGTLAIQDGRIYSLSELSELMGALHWVVNR